VAKASGGAGWTVAVDALGEDRRHGELAGAGEGEQAVCLAREKMILTRVGHW